MHVRFGNLRRLPEDYQGERHREIAQWLPARDGQEWVEFVEVPGPRRAGMRRPPGFLDASMWPSLNRIQHVHDGEHKQHLQNVHDTFRGRGPAFAMA
jgi:hypothetical protein